MDNIPDNNSINIKYYFFHKKIIFYILAAVLFLGVSYYFFISPPFNFPKEAAINIKEGSSLRSISKYLEENNIIRSRVAFETLVIFLGGEKHIALGDYYFEKRLSVYGVAKRISDGERNLTPVKITIPEGFSVEDIANTFSLKLSNFNESRFLDSATDKEGYLFPDTYFFFTSDNEKDVLRSMSDNFNKKISTILPQISSSGKSEREIIIMASLIEKESKGDIDRDIISGILWKRISLNMPLQVDAEPSTYKNKGLPEKPIANPGLAAIKAALYPKKTNYLYYLHDKEGNVHFASTFEEHKMNKQKYLRKI